MFRTRAQMRHDQAEQFNPVRQGAAEVHRANAPQQQKPDQSAQQILGALNGIKATIAGLAAKIGTA